MPGDKGLGQAQGGLEEAAAGVQGGSQQTLYFSSSNIGKVPEYNSTEDFNLYLERLEQYFIANFIEEDRRVAVLLTVIGSQTYKILRDLCDPVLPKDKTFEDICFLEKRIEFYEAKQNLTETINEWYARIKNLAIPCSFGSLLEEVLKDKFVTGLRRGKILDRLCEEEATKTMQELLEIAVKKEASAREQTEEVHKISFNETQKRKEEEKKAKDEVTEEENNENLDSMAIFSLNTETKVEAIEIHVLLNGIKVKMELDTGAGASVISSTLCRKLFPDIRLERTEIKRNLRMCLQINWVNMNSRKIELKLKEHVPGIFKKPVPVPYAYKEKIEKELERLEQNKIITKVDNSKWGTPLVPVIKSDGLINRQVRTNLDLLKSKTEDYRSKLVENFKGSRNIVFKENESVFARDYRNPNKKGWKKAVIEEVLGERTYFVRVIDENVVWKRHTDQLIKVGDFYERDMSIESDKVVEQKYATNTEVDNSVKFEQNFSNEQNEIVNLNDENSLARNVEEPGKTRK
ncbi:hypothetical protein NQ317_017360 [Molorchus minor]|uniref:Uncharacterized protein n=1 Tax=Molorchus minor TaxID=1323400 RepID=A0ABQ9J8M4_9CUCU|nr:hypothetical protein NQ317_017360 [Molorchus minor]